MREGYGNNKLLAKYKIFVCMFAYKNRKDIVGAQLIHKQMNSSHLFGAFYLSGTILST